MSRSFRYNLILALVALGTGLAAVAGWRFARASAPVSGPIVLVSIDALRADHLPVYGYTEGATPALDALARDGIVFEHAYSHSPQTLPAHTALLSGRLPFDNGVRDDVGFAVPGSVRLVAQMLADRGYVTGGIVSSFALRRQTGVARGFTFFDDELDDAESRSEIRTVRRDGAESEKRAERWLSAAGTSRAFLFLQLDEPHAPYTPPERFAQLGPYDGEIAYADELLGRLVAYLKKQQLYEQSTIIVVGDHGEGLGTHGEAGHGLLVFDDTIRVPFIIKQAAGDGAGRRVRELVQHVDIVPTILDLARAPIPDGLAGQSLRPALEGQALPARLAYAESLFAHYQYGWGALTTVTDGRFRYVNGPEPALYDLRNDPALHANIIAAQPVEATRLARELKVFEDAAIARPTVQPSEPAVDERERLLALGFLGPRSTMDAEAPDETIDPATRYRVVEAYRTAVAAVAGRKWSAGIEQLRAIARQHPEMLEIWSSLASVAVRAERNDVAADAYRRILMADATAVDARLGLSWALFRARRLEDARQQAELAVEAAAEESPAKARAHELLARIAVAKHDPGSARVQAQHVLEADPASPVPAFIEGRLLFERGRFEDALPLLDEAVEQLSQGAEARVVDLHFLRGETLTRLYRTAEAEDAYLTELKHFPENIRARAALATLYHSQERHDDATTAIGDMTGLVGTPDAFETAARLWTTFGDRDRAAAVRAEAQRAFEPLASPPAGHQ